MRWILLLLMLVICSAAVSAHIVPFSETYVEHEGNEISFRMEAPVWLNMSNPVTYNYTYDYIYGGFVVLNDGEPCELKDLKISYDEEIDYSYYNFTYSCKAEMNDVDIVNLLFYDIFGYYFEQYLLFDCGDDNFKYMYSDMENVTNYFNAKDVCMIFTEKDEMAKRIFINNTYKQGKESIEIPQPAVETEVYGPELPPENLPTGFIAASPATKEKEMSFFNKIVGGVKAGEISILLLILFSFMFGVMHSFSPGHGKSVIVSYLLGKDAKIRDVATLSATTALTHISDVFIISLLFMFLIPKSLKTNFTGYINAGAAVLIFLFGVYLVAKNYKKYKHFLQHRFGHSNHHHDHDHHHHHPTSRKELFLAGVLTGLAPCPTAWAIFLLLVGLGLYFKAFISVMAFSLGLVLTILTIGTIFIKAKGLIKFIPEETKLAAHLPMLSSVLIVIIGIVLTVKNFILPYFWG